MTPEQKIESVAKQIRQAELGIIPNLTCPYCEAVTKPGETLCCLKMAKAVAAVLQRVELSERLELAERIAEKALVN